MPEGRGEDLVALGRAVVKKTSPLRLVMKYFHEVIDRGYYDNELFMSLRNLIESKKMLLLIQSEKPFAEIVPDGYSTANITSLMSIVKLGR